MDGDATRSVQWFGIKDVTCQPRTSTDLANPAAWVNYGPVLSGTNGPASFAFPLTAEPTRFFRLQTGG